MIFSSLFYFGLYKMVVDETILSPLERATVKLWWTNNSKKFKEYATTFVIKNIWIIAIIFLTAHLVRHVKGDVKRYGYKDIDIMFYSDKSYADKSYACWVEKMILNSEIFILSCYMNMKVEHVLNFALKE